MDVVIPAYNSAQFLAETVQSVLNQRRPPDSVTVVDDASDDGTVRVAKSFGPAVRVITNADNAGPGARRNQGAQAGSGKYIAFLDADDVWEPDHLETVAGLLDMHPDAGVAFSRSRLFGLRNEDWPREIPCEGRPGPCFPEMMRNLFCHIGSSVIRREAFDRVGGFNDLIEFYKGKRVQGEDFDLLLRLSLDTPFVGTSRVTFRYRWHPAMSSRHIAPQIIMGFKYRLRLLEKLKSDPARTALIPVATDRMRMCWNEHLELLWSRRDIPGLRMMIEFGKQHEDLLDVTKEYARRASVPRWMTSLVDSFRSAKKSGAHELRK